MFARVILIVLLIAGSRVLQWSTAPANAQRLGTMGLRMRALELRDEAIELQENARGKMDLETAVEKWEELIEVLEQLGMKDKIARVYAALGSIYRGTSEYDKAKKCFEKVLMHGDTRFRGLPLGALGKICFTQGRYDKAREYGEKALPLMRKTGDIRGESRFLAMLGAIRGYQGRYREALKYCDEALPIARKAGDLKSQKVALEVPGMIYSVWGQYGKAVEYYEEALKAARKLRVRKRIGDEGEAGSVFRNLGQAYKDWGRYGKARHYFREALEYAQEQSSARDEGHALNCLGDVSTAQGQYKSAAQYYERSLRLARKVGDRKSRATTLNQLGIVYKNRGRYRQALTCFERALGSARRIGLIKVQGSAQSNMGELYAKRGQYKQAADCFKRASQTAGRLRDVKVQARTLDRLGMVHQAWGDYDKALASYKQSMAMLKRMRIPAQRPIDLMGHLYLDLGRVEKAETIIKKGGGAKSRGRLDLVKGDYEAARVHYEKLLKLAEKNRNADNLFAGYTGLGLVHEGLGDDAGAAENFRKAIECTEELRSSLSRGDRAAFYNVRVGGFLRTAPYEGLARVLTKSNKPLEALKESEYTKARMFAEALARRAEGTAADSELNDRLAALLKSRQRAYQNGKKQVVLSLEPQIRVQREKLDAHVKALREKFPLFAATKYPQPMELAQTGLRNEEWVLAYDVTDSGVLLCLTKGGELKKGLFKPIPRTELDGLVRKFREPMEIGPGDKVLEKLKSFDFDSGRKLRRVLLEDAVSEIPEGVPVMIVPDDSLGVLPFEMLVLNDEGQVKGDREIPYVSGARFFGDRNPIAYYQSITGLTLARTLAGAAKPGDRLLVMADPVFQAGDKRARKTKPAKGEPSDKKYVVEPMSAIEDSGRGRFGFQRLPLTGEPAKGLSALFEGKSDVYTGLDASRKNFLKNISPDLGRYGTIVFAVHGYLDCGGQGKMEPVLVLSMVPRGVDGFLKMSEVMGLRMNSEIVALTACQSGLGKVISGEGTMGMGRAFQYAGAKSVLMSLWSVSESSSVELVESFFKHIKEGKSKAEALRTARTEIRRAGYDHPFFWAPFILVGEVR